MKVLPAVAKKAPLEILRNDLQLYLDEWAGTCDPITSWRSPTSLRVAYEVFGQKELARLRLVPLDLLANGEQHWRGTFSWGPMGGREHRTFRVIGKMSFEFMSMVDLARMTAKAKAIWGVSGTVTTGNDLPLIVGERLPSFVSSRVGRPLAANWFSQANDQVEITYRDTATQEDPAARIDATRTSDPIGDTWAVTLGWYEGRRLQKIRFVAAGPLTIDEGEGVTTTDSTQGNDAVCVWDGPAT